MLPAEPASADDWAQYKPPAPHGPKPWRNVRDALTYGEERTYDAIFTKGQPHGTLAARAVLTGVRRISEWSGISLSNTHRILRTLVKKEVIECRRSRKHNDGKLYIAFPDTEIMRRWRTAGLTHVLKRSHGVRLKTGPPVTGDPVSKEGPSTTEPPLQTEPPAVTRPEIRNKEEVLATPTPPPRIRDGIIRVLGMIDDDDVSLLIRKCRRRAPDATDEEIAELAAVECGQILHRGKVDTRVDRLMRRLPKCFEGERFAHYRESAENAERFAQCIGLTDEPVKPDG